MADNRTIINNSGNVGVDYVVATDEIGGVNWQRVKMTWGIDGVAVDASAATPLPVDDDASQVILSAIQTALGGTLAVAMAVALSGGYLTNRKLSGASTNSTNVKGTFGQVYGWYLYNLNAAVRYLKLYNKAAAPTVGTDTPTHTIPIPPGGGANIEIAGGLEFTLGIGFGITTGIADNDTGAVAANDVIVNLFYK